MPLDDKPNPPINPDPNNPNPIPQPPLVPAAAGQPEGVNVAIPDQVNEDEPETA